MAATALPSWEQLLVRWGGIMIMTCKMAVVDVFRKTCLILPPSFPQKSVTRCPWGPIGGAANLQRWFHDDLRHHTSNVLKITFRTVWVAAPLATIRKNARIDAFGYYPMSNQSTSPNWYIFTSEKTAVKLKSVSFENVLEKLIHPKNHKNGPIEINGIIGAVFVNFWMNRFSKVFS